MFKNAIITHGAMHKRPLRASTTGKIGPRAGYACVAEVPKRWCDSFVVVRPCWPPPRRSRCSRLLRGGGQHQRRWHTCSSQLARDHRSNAIGTCRHHVWVCPSTDPCHRAACTSSVAFAPRYTLFQHYVTRINLPCVQQARF